MNRRRIVRRPVVEEDIFAIADQIAAANPRAAARSTLAVRTTEEALLAMPGIGAKQDFDHPMLAGMRFHLVRGFRKYLI